jgi:hypothetical protein
MRQLLQKMIIVISSVNPLDMKTTTGARRVWLGGSASFVKCTGANIRTSGRHPLLQMSGVFIPLVTGSILSP